MKLQSLLTLIIAGMAFSFASAQTLQFEDTQVTYDKTTYPAIQVTLSPSPETVRDEWKDYLKKYHDVKLKRGGLFASNDVIMAEEVDFDQVSPKAMNFYTKFEDVGDETRMYVFGTLGYDIYVNPMDYPREYNNMYVVVDNFLNQFLPDYYQNKIDNTLDLVEDLEEDKTDMEKDIADKKAKIEKNLKENEELRAEIEELEQQVEQKAGEIETANQQLQERQNAYQRINSRLSKMR